MKNTPILRPYLFCVPAMFITLVGPAKAAVLEVRGRVATTVQEFLSGTPASVTSDESEVGVDAAELPITAGASLQTKDFTDRVIALGQGVCDLASPILDDSNGPREFGLEVAGFCEGNEVVYAVTGTALESRRLLFAGPGNPSADAEFVFNPDGTREIESTVSLSGAIVVWSLVPQFDAREIESELTIEVRRDAQTGTLFRSAVTLMSPSSDMANSGLRVRRQGPIRTQQLGVDELVALGLDDESAGILRAVEEAGSLAVFVIPRQDHSYRHAVRQDEELTLHAELTASVRTAPGSTGSAATLGRPFHNLADFIGRAIPGVDGQRMQKAVNRAIASPDGGSSADAPAPPRARALCGVLGAELFLAPLVALFASMRRAGRHNSFSV